MLFVIQLALVLAPAALSPQTAESSAQAQTGAVQVFPAVEEGDKECQRAEVRVAIAPSPTPRARRLDELPQGRLEYAVMREVDGCVIPAVVHERVGAPPDLSEDDRR
jgi:hypothetical protein